MKTENLIKEKSALETAILEAVTSFEKKTGLMVSDIEVERNMYSFPNNSSISAINVGARL